MTTTIYRCCNGSCRYMDDLKCTLDEITITNGGDCKDYKEAGGVPEDGKAGLCGYRRLDDHELVQLGDVVEDKDEGEFYNVSMGSIHGLMVGVPAGKARTWSGVADVLRKREVQP